jgi:hypothetical protein
MASRSATPKTAGDERADQPNADEPERPVHEVGQAATAGVGEDIEDQ